MSGRLQKREHFITGKLGMHCSSNGAIRTGDNGENLSANKEGTRLNIYFKGFSDMGCVVEGMLHSLRYT